MRYPMLRRKTLRLALVVALLSSCTLAQTVAPDPDAARLREHVTLLASDKFDGRKTGTPGAESAARYIAEEFRKYGLAPGGDSRQMRSDAGRGYLQRFPYAAGVEAGKANALSLHERISDSVVGEPLSKFDLRLGEDWMPLGWGASGRAERVPVAFVGYGIKAAELNYDDYAGANVEGRAAIAFASAPDGDDPHGRFTRFSDLRLRAAAARAAGARALVLVARELNFKDDRMARLSYDNAGDAGLPVIVVSRRAAARMLGIGGATHLDDFERKLRESKSSAAQTPAPASHATPARTPAPLAQDVAPRVMLDISTDVVRRDAPAHNVVGVLLGSDPQLRGEAIVVGAHYDHLGRGGQGSLAPREGDVHHGADDNASGTAALLELARLLASERGRLRRTVVFVAFGGEEEGLLGSKHYVEHPAHPISQTVAMINMDMVGRLREGRLMIGGVGTAGEWRELIERANSELNVRVDATGANASQDAGRRERMPVVIAANGQVVATAAAAPRFNLSLGEDGFGPSDHSSFYAKRIPVLFFFTGAHEDYHKPSDTADRINYEGVAHITSFVRRIVEDLHEAPKRPAFATAKTETGARTTGFRVYLGTVPSYGEATDGLRLDGVREGSPAERAGLKAGDKIVRLAGRDVRNVYDYTNALSEMKAGEEYEVEVVREGARLTLKITPAARK